MNGQAIGSASPVRCERVIFKTLRGYFMGRSKTLQVTVCALALFGLAGCVDYSSPKGIVGSAYKALSKNDTKAFTKTLSGEALDRYGNLEGMIVLQRELTGLEVKVGKVTLTGTERENRRVELEKYTVDVVGRKRGEESAQYTAVMTAKVECEHSWSYHYEPYLPAHLDRPGYPGYPGYGPGYDYGYGRSHGHMVREENRSCQIAAVEL